MTHQSPKRAGDWIALNASITNGEGISLNRFERDRPLPRSPVQVHPGGAPVVTLGQFPAAQQHERECDRREKACTHTNLRSPALLPAERGLEAPTKKNSSLADSHFCHLRDFDHHVDPQRVVVLRHHE